MTDPSSRVISMKEWREKKKPNSRTCIIKYMNMYGDQSKLFWVFFYFEKEEMVVLVSGKKKFICQMDWLTRLFPSLTCIKSPRNTSSIIINYWILFAFSKNYSSQFTTSDLIIHGLWTISDTENLRELQREREKERRKELKFYDQTIKQLIIIKIKITKKKREEKTLPKRSVPVDWPRFWAEK